eukprot:EG_transcript_9656
MPDLRWGTQIKDYTIELPIGRGRFSTVYRASKEGSDLKYAVKVVSKKEAGLPAYKGTRKEAVLLQNLDHPNLIHVYEYEEEYGMLYVIMELLEGGDLFDKITELKNYTEGLAARLTRNVVTVLHYLHSNGVCHRDVKPENLMLRRRKDDGGDLESLYSDIVLVDFGTATKFYGFEEGCDASMTDFMGTPEYMAPEVIQTDLKQRLGYNEKCDIWSTGVVVYILLCGWPPFFAESQQLLFDRILRGQLSFPPNTVWDRISPEAKDFVSRCLSMEPQERPSAAELLQHAWLAEEEPAGAVEIPVSPEMEEIMRGSFSASLEQISLRASVRNLKNNIDNIKATSKPNTETVIVRPAAYSYSREWEFNARSKTRSHAASYNGCLLFTFADEHVDPPAPPKSEPPPLTRRASSPL